METPQATTVLIVEDNVEVLDFVREVLDAAGYRVLTATTGTEAIALSAAEPNSIHLLVTDLVLTDLRGQALASRLRATRPELRVLYISGYPSEVFTAEGQRVLDAPLLMKPFLISDLEQVVRETLGPSSYPHPPFERRLRRRNRSKERCASKTGGGHRGGRRRSPRS